MQSSNTPQQSEYSTEFMSNKPSFLVRWGMLIFLITLLLFVFTSWFIKYPDVINTNAKFTTLNAPKEVVTKLSGKLIKLFAKEGIIVTKGEILGYMESTANHEQVIVLANNIDSLQVLLIKNNIEQIPVYSQTVYSQLGELQSPNQIFLQALLNFKNYISNGFYLKKKTMLAGDLSYLKKLHSNLLQQKGLNTQDLELAQKTFDANQSLKDENIIADLEYRNEKSKLINKKLTLPQISSAIISNESQQHEKQKEIMELENTIAQQKSIFCQALNTFKSEVENWRKTYLLTAPVDGKVAFASFLQENQQLQNNQIICFINPGNSNYYAEVFIPQTNFGKIRLGQKILLKLPSYPFQEYGAIEGRLDFISNIPTDSGYLARVILLNGLKTNFNKLVQYREGLLAQGEIITADMRLLQRFYYSIIKQVK